MNKFVIFLVVIIAGYQIFTKPPSLSAQEIDPSCDVVVFTTATCPYCKKARDFLNAEGIAWCEKDIGKNVQDRALYKKLGGKGVPFAIFADNKVQGFFLETYQEESAKI